MTQKERELRQKMDALSNSMKALVDNDKRSAEQDKELKALTNEMHALNAELDSVIALDNAKRRLTAIEQPTASNSVWNNSGEFFAAVRNAAFGRVDERLLNAASGNTTGVDADGGYAVDRDFLPKLVDMMVEQSTFFKGTSKITISAKSNAIRLPIGKRGYSANKDGDIVAVHGGVAASWTAEAAKIAISKAKTDVLDLKLEKVTAMVAASEELIEDSTAFTSYMKAAAPKAISTVIDLGILNGAGGAVPVGIFDSKNKNIVVIDAEAQDKAVTIKDVNKMYSALLPELRDGAAWYVNPEMEGNFSSLESAKGEMVYLPAGSLAGKPYGTLKGLPVIATQKLAATGAKGDILLANMNEYQIIQKGGMQMDMSIHVLFDTAESLFRFIFRVNGSPLYTSKYTSLNDNFELASFVTLGERTTIVSANVKSKSKGKGQQQDQIPPA